MRGTIGLALIAALLAVAAAALVACGEEDDGGGDTPRSGPINVAIVDTPNTQDLAHLTPSLFTRRTHIKVSYTILDEGTLREVITHDVPANGRRFDAVMIGPIEAQQYGRNGNVTDLTRFALSDRAYKLDDIIPTVRSALSYHSKLYASPFYGESSFLMYRRDVLKNAGIAVPANPT
jgi:sorbitol/mannitol transport system substrate-binding protein